MAPRRRFGRLRQLPSGRWQARYTTPSGKDVAAPSTFATKTAAQRWLAAVETDLARGQWVDPQPGKDTLATYAEQWLRSRPDLKIRTQELYRWLLDKYVLPALGPSPLAKLSPAVVRQWHADMVRERQTDTDAAGLRPAQSHPQHRGPGRGSNSKPLHGSWGGRQPHCGAHGGHS